LEEFGVSTTSVRLVGGGAKNLLWRQLVADVLDKPVLIPKASESAALGAALQAAAAFFGADIAEFVRENEAGVEEGVVEPDVRKQARLGEALARHNAAGEALFGQPTGSSV
jgi:xylulokinase